MYVGVDISVCAELWFSHLSRVQLFATPWTLACLASLPMGFPKQEYLSGLPFPTPGDLPNPEVKPASLVFCISKQILYHCASWEALNIQ